MSISEQVARQPRTTGLIVIAIAMLAMAGSVWGDPTQCSDDLAVWHLAIPTIVRSSLWGAAGLLALAGAFWGRWETCAYRIATIMPVERAMSYLWSWIVWAAPGPPAGDQWAIFHAMFWAALAFVIVWASGLTQWRPMDA